MSLLNLPNQSSPRASVAASVRAHLAAANIKPARAAMALGMSQSKMSRRTTGAQPFDVDELGLLADLLGVPLSAFTSGTVAPGGDTPGGIAGTKGLGNLHDGSNVVFAHFGYTQLLGA